MSVSVTKSPSVLVRPSSETVSISHHSTINLSPSDKDLNVPVTALLMFEHPIHEVSNTIKRALSQALVHYYPIAGRRVAGADAGEAHIHCNGEGVAFVSAIANCALKEAMSLDRSNNGARTLLDELAIFGHTNGFGPTDPPLLMQVTEFLCGGFVLGVTWNHAVADGAGMGQFLQAVGELARGLPAPSVAPVRWDESLQMPAPEVSKALQQALTSGDTFDDLAWVDFTIPSRVITRIKAEFGGRFAGGEPCSKFEAASAVMWQCRTRVTMRNPEAPALFSFVANLRQHVGAKKGYYGNCLAMQFVTATSGMVANGDVVDLVKMIKDTKGKIADKFRKNDGRNDPEPEQAVGETTQEVAQLRYDMLFVSSWGNLGFDEADFGSGRPARVTPYPEEKPTFPACTMCLRWKGKDGVNVLSAMLREEHVEAFRQELARFT